MDAYDVAVVGAGPAGSAAAYHLAQQGARVLMLEKSEFPREKVCGDGLTPRAVKQLVRMGVDLDGPGWLRNKGLRIIGGGIRMELDWPELATYPNYGLTRTRLDFDDLLVKQAVKAGAELRTSHTVTEPVLDEATGRVVGVRAEIGPDQQPEALRAPLVLAGAWEWSAFPGFTDYSARLTYVAFVGICLVATWYVGVDNGRSDLMLYAALAWWGLALLWIALAPSKVNRATAALAGLFVLLPVWVALVRLHAEGPQLLLFLLLLVVAADIGAYATGRLIGRVKLAPKVSPGKTWEGVGGGVLLALAVAWVASAWLDLAPLPLLAVAVPTALVSVIGDLTVSMLKRNIGLKDTGRLLPGHGGVMDRIDGLIAAVPAYAAGLRLAGLVS